MRERLDQGVAVVGAAGFVGRALLHALERIGIRGTAVVRGAPELALDGDFHRAISLSELSSADTFHTVINLAYPTDGSPREQPAQNAAIVRTVNDLLRDGGHLIHVSTQAVFGVALDRPVQVGPVRPVRDLLYVELKIAAEQAFARSQAARALSIDIVRPGNVIGYGSGAWGVPLVQRLLTGRPVGVAGHDGPSNATDVANVASYLAHLAHAGDHDAGLRYHHLAEFSSVTWGEWIAPIAERMGIEPVLADPSALRLPVTPREELAAALRSSSPRNIYRAVAGERVLGSWSRTLLGALPAPVFARAKGHDLVFATEAIPDRGEQTFLAIVATDQEFQSVVDPRWTPVVTREQSLARFLKWLHRN